MHVFIHLYHENIRSCVHVLSVRNYLFANSFEWHFVLFCFFYYTHIFHFSPKKLLLHFHSGFMHKLKMYIKTI